jgi:hypothetical protein
VVCRIVDVPVATGAKVVILTFSVRNSATGVLLNKRKAREAEDHPPPLRASG